MPRKRASTACLLAALCALAACGARPGPATSAGAASAPDAPRRFVSPTAYEAYLRAELAAAAGDYPDAARQLDLASIADPRDPYLPARRAEFLALSGDADAALEAAEQTARDFPESAAAWLALGEVRALRHNDPGATEAFGRALALAGDDAMLRAAIAQAQHLGGATVYTPVDMALGPGSVAAEPRPSQRRERADQAFRAHDDRGVDRLLGPLVATDRATVADRVRLIEARARDGRGAEAAGLVPGVAVGSAPSGVSRAEHARLWLLAGRNGSALEEADAALADDPDDVLAHAVAGEARLRAGQTVAAFAHFAAVPPASGWYVPTRVLAARALDLQARPELADRLLADAVSALPATDAAGRDRLRAARAELLLRRGRGTEARAALAGVDTPWGRQRRGALLADAGSPAEVLNDLRARTGDRYEDAVADAWVALVCTLHPEGCSPGERDRALASAAAGAPGAAETLRARAVGEGDRAQAGELLRRAEASDPLSPWNGRLFRLLGAADRTRGP